MRNMLLASAMMLAMAGAAAAQTAPAASDGVTSGAATSATPAEIGATKPARPHPVMRHPRRMAHPAATGAADIRPGHEPGVGDSFPASNQASNITGGDTKSTIAPRLPAPAGGPNASAGTFLSDAQRALNAGQTGRAQEALERAETAMLQRSVPATMADSPSEAPDVTQVKMARDALANRDVPGAQRAITAALSAGR